MKRPFRFGVVISRLLSKEWIQRVTQIEDLGYSSLLWPDHFRTQWEPVTALAAVAAVTKRLKIGSLMFCNDFRHPVLVAKSAATIQVLSGGRLEFGIGAGWMESDYHQTGIPFDPPKLRIERLDEALKIIRNVWIQDNTSFLGKHYRVTDSPKVVELFDLEKPLIMVGGGGKKILKIAARHADIVGIAPTFYRGKFSTHNITEFNNKCIREKINWVRENAEAEGRDPDDIEFNSQVFGLYFTNDPKSIYEEIAERWNVSVEDVVKCPLFLVGSGRDLRRHLMKYRAETGINYIAIPGSDPSIVEQFARLVLKHLK